MANRYVLDTHTVVLGLSAPKKLGKRAKAAMTRIESGSDEAWIPAAVALEISLLRELGRIEFGLLELRETLEDTPSIRFLDLERKQLDIFSTLAQIRDPFDRLILSAARFLEAKLITKDETLEDTGIVQTIWS